MDAGTRVRLVLPLVTVVLPAVAAVAVLLLGRRLRPATGDRHALTALATITGLLTAYLGIKGGWSDLDAGRWTVAGAVVAGLLLLPFDLRRLPSHTYATGALALVVLPLSSWLLLSPLAGVWQSGGALAQVAQGQWVVDAAAIALVAWLCLDRIAHRLPTPAALGAVAVAAAAGGASAMITGSLTVAQLFGGLAAVAAAVGFFGWWRPDVRPGHAAVGTLAVMLALLALYAHFYVEVPRPTSTLLVLTPLVAAAALPLRRTLPAVAVAVGLALLPAGASVWLAWQADVAKAAAAEQGPDESDPYGDMYY